MALEDGAPREEVAFLLSGVDQLHAMDLLMLLERYPSIVPELLDTEGVGMHKAGGVVSTGWTNQLMISPSEFAVFASKNRNAAELWAKLISLETGGASSSSFSSQQQGGDFVRACSNIAHAVFRNRRGGQAVVGFGPCEA